MAKRSRYIYTYNGDLLLLRKKIRRYFRYRLFKRIRYRKEIGFIKKEADPNCGISFVFPYPFVFSYNKDSVEVFPDESAGLHYVMYKGKKLYYKRNFSVERIKELHHSILVEQDERSPHCYFSGILEIKEGDVVVDIGAAEGNFSLEIVQKAGKVYIFETDEGWIEALNATFAPWKEKVQIINKYVSDEENGHATTLETALKGEQRIDFMKMDVEGAETLILKSSSKLLQDNNSLQLAICTYHQQPDEREIKKLLKQNGYRYTTTSGYMLFIYGDPIEPPYFRRGLILARKTP